MLNKEQRRLGQKENGTNIRRNRLRVVYSVPLSPALPQPLDTPVSNDARVVQVVAKLLLLVAPVVVATALLLNYQPTAPNSRSCLDSVVPQLTVAGASQLSLREQTLLSAHPICINSRLVC